ncbi:MAG TPA: hypothetical protein VIJ64_07025 [Candidatus Lustribacter sp.]
MSFDSIDEYLLSGGPRKADVIAALLRDRSPAPAARPFYEGMQMLGARTPDLSLVALRLVLAGKSADDAGVVELRDLAARAREGDLDARAAYRRLVGE